MASKYKTMSIIRSKSRNGGRVKTTVEVWHPAYLPPEKRAEEHARIEDGIVSDALCTCNARDIKVVLVK
jgi:hypothetical protein